MTAREPPSGFIYIPHPSPYVRHLNGQMYQRYSEDGVRTIGTWLEAQHCNAQGSAHGGYLLTLADFALTYGKFEPDVWEPTITLNITADFIGPARQDDWIEARARIFKKSSSLMFGEVHMYVGDAVIVRASGVCRPVPPPGTERKR